MDKFNILEVLIIDALFFEIEHMHIEVVCTENGYSSALNSHENGLKWPKNDLKWP